MLARIGEVAMPAAVEDGRVKKAGGVAAGEGTRSSKALMLVIPTMMDLTRSVLERV